MSTRIDAPAAPPRGSAPRHRSRAASGRKGGRGTGGRRSEISVLSGIGHLFLALWALIVLAPLVWTFLASFKTNEEIFGQAWTLPGSLLWENWVRAWNEANVGQYFVNSVIVVAGGVFGTMLLGSMAAYVLARYTFVGNRFIYYLFVSGLAFPVFLALVPLFFVVRNLGLLNTHTGLILVYVAYSLPFTVFFLAAFFKTLPISVAEAAMIDGCSHTRLFFQVMLPMAKPGLVSITIFNIIGQWNQYLLPLALLQGEDAEQKWVLTQGVANISVNAGFEADWGGLFAALSMAILPMIAMYAVFQRQIQQGLTAGAVK